MVSFSDRIKRQKGKKMKVYEVTIPCLFNVTVEIEAKNEEEARELAIDQMEDLVYNGDTVSEEFVHTLEEDGEY